MKKILFVLSVAFLLASCSKNDTAVPDAVSATNVGLDLKTLGASAHDLLSSDKYKTLNIEIQYSPGMQLNSQTVSNLVSYYQALLNKPSGVTVSQTQVASFGKSTVTLDDVTAFESANRKQYSNGSVISLYIICADAAYTTTGVIGVAYHNTSLCVFEKTVQGSSGGVSQASRVTVETGTMEHESGHLFGLVNNGTAMVTAHEDASHKGHCNNQNCLMYFQLETSGILGMSSVPALDANCKADLQANGGR